MKSRNEFISCTALLIFGLFSFFACNSREISEIDSVSHKIDSLIEVHRLNEQCVLVKFGGDAVTAISTKKGIVVVDAGISTGLTQKYRKIIENELHRNDFAYVINTHGHPDHNGGNSVFPEARIIGHVNGIKEISEQWKYPEKVINSLGKLIEEFDRQLKSNEQDREEWNRIFTLKTRYRYAYYDAKNLLPITPPDITFSDSLNLDMGDFTFQLFYFGNCHSSSDILIYVPGMKMLFTGDLFFKYGTPSIGYDLPVDKQRRELAFQWIRDRQSGIETIIGGHGQILTPDDLSSFTERILEKIEE